mmetsp:Transcript_121382/g.377748  ORF Transcript_121382/g.377748 Transcript_121382/m.377748 type:complete len:258 (+) Transcript_121382:134-907(+)
MCPRVCLRLLGLHVRGPPGHSRVHSRQQGPAPAPAVHRGLLRALAGRAFAERLHRFGMLPTDDSGTLQGPGRDRHASECREGRHRVSRHSGRLRALGLGVPPPVPPAVPLPLPQAAPRVEGPLRLRGRLLRRLGLCRWELRAHAVHPAADHQALLRDPGVWLPGCRVRGDHPQRLRPEEGARAVGVPGRTGLARRPPRVLRRELLHLRRPGRADGDLPVPGRGCQETPLKRRAWRECCGGRGGHVQTRLPVRAWLCS